MKQREQAFRQKASGSEDVMQETRQRRDREMERESQVKWGVDGI
jgi:hypothetical protein